MMCEVPEFYSEVCRTARRQHICCETRRAIQPGELYWYISGKWDGRMGVYKQSEAAYHFARFINGVKEGGDESKYDGENCIIFGDIGAECPEDFREEWEQVRQGKLTRWTRMFNDTHPVPIGGV